MLLGRVPCVIPDDLDSIFQNRSFDEIVVTSKKIPKDKLNKLEDFIKNKKIEIYKAYFSVSRLNICNK